MNGGVDSVTVSNGGSGYVINPVVVFDAPNLTPPAGVTYVQATGTATMAGGVVTGVSVVNPGTGYSRAPGVTINDGLLPPASPGVAATAVATIAVNQIDVTAGGAGYDQPPTVVILDTGAVDRGAEATATIAIAGAVTSIVVNTPGAGYLTPGIRKFVNTLPGLGKANAPTANATNLGNYIPVAIPDTHDLSRHGLLRDRARAVSPPVLHRRAADPVARICPAPDASHRRPAPRGSVGAVLTNANLDPTHVTGTPTLLPDGTTTVWGTPCSVNGAQALGVDMPRYLGPTISATKDRPVRILFRNLLPTGVGRGSVPAGRHLADGLRRWARHGHPRRQRHSK